MSTPVLPEERDELERPVYGPYAYARSLMAEGSQVLDAGRTHLRFYDPATMVLLRPSATRLVDRRFFEPHATRWRAVCLRVGPTLSALHVVLVWQRHVYPPSAVVRHVSAPYKKSGRIGLRFRPSSK